MIGLGIDQLTLSDQYQMGTVSKDEKKKDTRKKNQNKELQWCEVHLISELIFCKCSIRKLFFLVVKNLGGKKWELMTGWCRISGCTCVHVYLW